MSNWKTEAFAELAVPLKKALGDETAKAFLGLGCETLSDLLRLLPRHLMSGTQMTDIAALIEDNRGKEEYVAVLAQVAKISVAGDEPKQRLEVRLTDGSAWLNVTFFGKPWQLDYWKEMLSASDRGIFAGKLGWFNKSAQLAHPAFAMITRKGFVGNKANRKMASQVMASSFIGLYPQTSKLHTWMVSESIGIGMQYLVVADDPMPEWVRERAGVLEMHEAFKAVHTPVSQERFDAGVRRLLFDEAFGVQLAMAYRREDASRHNAVPRVAAEGGLVSRLDERLPFRLTREQAEVGEVIAADLARKRPMQRLLQGEVGAGKTVIALRAMLAVVDAGGQAVLMAPTEVLAQQHWLTVTGLMGDLVGGGLLAGGGPATDVVLLTGSMTAGAKSAALEKIASGQAGIVIGTHALLSAGVRFFDLGLVVIDEQHRFGVEQRKALGEQAVARPHMLVMTATPIPRSVALTVFGDLDLSTLTQIPAGRARVTTTVVDQVAHPGWVDRAWDRIREEVAQGRQAYVVAPRIDASERNESASVVALADKLGSGPLKGLRLAVLHGRLPSAEKTDIMNRFSAGTIDVLVATSMIEVGLDQPNVSMMVIWDADRFGISQLHQLRGRIGRGAYPGLCLLMTGAEEGSPTRARLDLVAGTRDGFALAQADLSQRREGDVIGMSQSGKRGALRLLNVLDHADLIEVAREVAAEVVAKDPDMTDPGIADYVADIEQRADITWDESA